MSNNRFEEIERQLTEQRQKMERASIQQQAHAQLEHEQRQRANDDARAAARRQQDIAEIRALLPANTDAVAAFYEAVKRMVSEGVLNLPALRERLTAIDATVVPIAEVTARAQSEANGWWSRHPNFDMRNPMGIGVQVSSPFSTPLPTAIDQRQALETLVTTSSALEYTTYAGIVFALTGILYRRIDQTRDLAPVLTVRPRW